MTGTHQNMTSTGRGGAGNIGDTAKSPRIQPADLETPTLKTSIYTTGRGGSGNMMPNKDPEITRASQDVNAIERVPSAGATHVGRGGAANVTKKPLDGEQDLPENDAANPNGNPGARKQSISTAQGLADKAKGLFKKT